jgi:hypothetical protein
MFRLPNLKITWTTRLLDMQSTESTVTIPIPQAMENSVPVAEIWSHLMICLKQF